MPLDTLEKLTGAKEYNQWVYELVRPYLGERVLEVGCGIGNMTEFWLRHARVLATDINPVHLQSAEKRWQDRTHLTTALWDVAKPTDHVLQTFHPDTVVCINILEHVLDDAQALRNMHKLLLPGGKLVLYVPALTQLFGSLDLALDHHRRYSKRQVRALAARAGFVECRMHFVNGLGIAGWWLNSRWLRRQNFSQRQIAVYDRIIPLLKQLERWIIPPLGQSLLYVGQKP